MAGMVSMQCLDGWPHGYVCTGQGWPHGYALDRGGHMGMHWTGVATWVCTGQGWPHEYALAKGDHMGMHRGDYMGMHCRG